MRVHRKVWLWFGPRWAVQLYLAPYISLGVHIDLRRPYIDLHLLWLIVSLGADAVLTPHKDRYRWSCRGFVMPDDPVL